MKYQNVCPVHGGKSPQAQGAAESREVTERFERVLDRQLTRSIPRRIDAPDALQLELNRCQASVEAMDDRFAKLDGTPPVEWVQLWERERDRLAKVADIMERHALKRNELNSRIDQTDIDRLDEAMRGVCTDLGIDPDDDVSRGLVAFHVRRVIGRPRPVEMRTCSRARPTSTRPLRRISEVQISTETPGAVV